MVCLVTWLFTQVDLTNSQETTHTVEAFAAEIKDIINGNGLEKFIEVSIEKIRALFHK